MENQTVTIYDVAREAGVSMATVSRVVNGNPNVKPSTRKKVSEVIERLNYRPNAVARGLASKKTTTVGVMIPNVTNVYFSALARGIDDIATMYKYNIILSNADDSLDKEITVFNNLLAKQVDGIIYMGRQVTPQLQELIDRNSTPVVVAGTDVEGEDFYSVNIDFQAAFKEVTKIFLDQGRRVALVTEDADYLMTKNQVAGYQAAYEEAGKAYEENLVIQGGFGHKDGDKLYNILREEGANAVVVSTDYVGAAIMNSALDDGLEVPKDLEVMTAQNSLITEIVRPQLSSIQQPLYDIGAVAMRLLTKVMNKEEIDEKKVVLPHKIRLRGSTDLKE